MSWRYTTKKFIPLVSYRNVLPCDTTCSVLEENHINEEGLLEEDLHLLEVNLEDLETTSQEKGESSGY